MDCSKTDIFAKEWERMCESFGKTSCSEKCPIWGLKSRPSMDCFMAFFENPEIVIQAVQKWSDEHPIEIDWSKVPVDTPVLVRDCDKEEWEEKYFVCYLQNSNGYKFAVFSGGLKQEYASNISLYLQCKLAPEVDPTPYLKD